MKKIKASNVALIVIAIMLIIFTVKMIDVYLTMGSVPDNLIDKVFIACLGECGIMGWIKTNKIKHIGDDSYEKWDNDNTDDSGTLG